MKIFLVYLCQTIVFVCGRQVNVVRSAGSKSDGKRKLENSSSDERENLKSNEKWVVDSIFYEDYQSDAPSGSYNSQNACPPVPDIITANACPNSSCQKDTDCKDEFRCCFTGCSFTCLPEVKPAPVVDWRKEPRRSRSGISWLINEAKEPISAEEACSTSPIEFDEDPLLCPDGYFCHITEEGNPKHGIPNSGYCVKTTSDQYSSGEEDLVINLALKGRQHCIVDNIVLLEGANITLENKSCQCRNGLLSCRGRSKQKVQRRRKLRKNKKSKQKAREDNRNS